MNKLKKLLIHTNEKVFIPLIMGISAVMGIFCLLLIFVPIPRPAVGDIRSSAGAEMIPQADAAQIEAEYKEKTSRFVKAYADLASKQEINPIEIDNIQKELLSLKVPTQFKDLHLELVMAAAKFKNFLSSGNPADRVTAEKAISDAKQDFSWLN